ncbi:unnamed protein product [Schistosoma curassoni]|uniref:Uncharacterized protein n=1 Tax=Schistosoma curassoni TaxID=6186 RepID=A0A183KXU8_9TREM|nr:unnamed protein product [Schistosoma curassoni]
MKIGKRLRVKILDVKKKTFCRICSKLSKDTNITLLKIWLYLLSNHWPILQRY